MKKLLLAAAIGVVVCAAPALRMAWADDASADDLKLQVKHLVRQLNDADLGKRTEAEQQLIALGPTILDLLPTYDDKSPPTEAQLREAVNRVRDRLQRQAADAATRASTVTLKARKPVLDVLAELTRQTGNKIKDARQQMGQEATNPTIDVSFDKTPFWAALDQTLDLAKLTVYPYTGADELGVVARGERALPRSAHVSYAGPLRFEALRLDSQRDLRTQGDSLLRLAVEVSWEPRLRPITLQQPLADVHAVDDQKTEIAVEHAEGQLERSIDPVGTAVEFQIPFVAPPRSARSISTVRGKLKALLPGKVETFEFTGLKEAKKVEQHRAGVTVVLDEVRQDGDAWEVRVRVRFENPGIALETFRSWIFNNDAYIVGADNQRISHAGFETTRQTQDEVGVAYKFDLPSGPDKLKFVYKTPAMLNNMPLEYEFKDLPLP